MNVKKDWRMIAIVTASEIALSIMKEVKDRKENEQVLDDYWLEKINHVIGELADVSYHYSLYSRDEVQS